MTFGDAKMRIDQTKTTILTIKSQIISNLFNETYGLRLGEFKNTTGTERVKKSKENKKIRKRNPYDITTLSMVNKITSSQKSINFITE